MRAQRRVELRPAGSRRRRSPPVDHRLVDLEHKRDLAGKRIEAATVIAVARYEAAVTLLETAEAPEAVVFEIE